MENVERLAWKGRVTKQGVRDLNYYGPRRQKAVVGDPAPVNDAETSKPVTGAAR